MPDEELTPTTTETPAADPGKDWLAGREAAQVAAVKSGRTNGPAFNPGGANTSLWYDQIFGADITPSGKVICPNALRVGATNQALYAALNADANNEGPMSFPSGSTITFEFQVSDRQDGTFKDIGPTVCVMAPSEGITAEPGDTICRVALPNFPVPWAKINITFTGSITGGLCVAGLGHAAR